MAYLFVLGSPIDRENFLGQEIITQANAFAPIYNAKLVDEKEFIRLVYRFLAETPPARTATSLAELASSQHQPYQRLVALVSRHRLFRGHEAPKMAERACLPSLHRVSWPERNLSTLSMNLTVFSSILAVRLSRSPKSKYSARLHSMIESTPFAGVTTRYSAHRLSRISSQYFR